MKTRLRIKLQMSWNHRLNLTLKFLPTHNLSQCMFGLALGLSVDMPACTWDFWACSWGDDRWVSWELVTAPANTLRISSWELKAARVPLVSRGSWVQSFTNVAPQNFTYPPPNWSFDYPVCLGRFVNSRVLCEQRPRLWMSEPTAVFFCAQRSR